MFLVLIAEQTVGFKSIGKAVKMGTKQIGKTMTAISESPDKRGQGRIGQVTALQSYSRDNRKDKRNQHHVSFEGSLGLDGKFWWSRFIPNFASGLGSKLSVKGTEA